MCKAVDRRCMLCVHPGRRRRRRRRLPTRTCSPPFADCGPGALQEAGPPGRQQERAQVAGRPGRLHGAALAVRCRQCRHHRGSCRCAQRPGAPRGAEGRVNAAACALPLSACHLVGLLCHAPTPAARASQVLNLGRNQLAGKIAVGRLRALKALILNENQLTLVGGEPAAHGQQGCAGEPRCCARACPQPAQTLPAACMKRCRSAADAAC